MGFLGELVIRITGQNAQFDQSIDSSEKKIVSFQKKAEALGKKLTAVGKKLTTFWTLPILAIGTAITKAAIDAEETASKFAAVFKDVSKESQEVAKNLAKDFGLSSNKAKQLLSNTGDLLTGFGFTGKAALDLSKDVNELAADLASFTNIEGGAERASAAITSALLGERESVKALGIKIIETDLKAKVLLLTQQGMIFESERQAEVYATLILAQEQSTNAIGDAIKTQESAANQIKRLKSDLEDLANEFGKELIPVVKSGIKFIRDIVGWFSSLDEGTKQIIIVMGGLVAAVGPVLKIFGKLTTLIATNPFLAAIVGVGLLTTGIIAFVNQNNKMNKSIETQKTSMFFLAKSVEDYKEELEDVQAVQEGMLLSDVEKEIKSLTRAQELLIKRENDLVEATTFVADTMGDILVPGLAEAIDASDVMNKTGKTTIEQQIELEGIRRDRAEVETKLTQLQIEQNRLLKETVDNSGAIIAHEGALEDFRVRRLSDIDREIEAVKKEAQEYIDNGVAKGEVNKWLKEQIEEITEATKEKNEIEIQGVKTTTADIRELERQRIGHIINFLHEREDAEKESLERSMINWKEVYGATGKIVGFIDDAFNSIVNVGDQFSKNEEIRLDNQYQKEKELFDENAKTQFEKEKERIENLLISEENKNEMMESLDKNRIIAIDEFEAPFEEKRKELKRKQAESEKESGIFSAIISGIQAVMQTFTSFGGWPIGVVPAGIMAGIAAAQVAAIAAQPIPSFAGGGLVMPTAGGAIVKMADAGVPEYAVPETTDIMSRLADRISANMNKPNVTNNNTTNNNMSPNMTLNIDGQDFYGFLTNASRDGKYFVDPNRGISRR